MRVKRVFALIITTILIIGISISAYARTFTKEDYPTEWTFPVTGRTVDTFFCERGRFMGGCRVTGRESILVGANLIHLPNIYNGGISLPGAAAPVVPAPESLVEFYEPRELSELEIAIRSGKPFRDVAPIFGNCADVQEAFEQEVVRLVNEIRVEHGLVPYVFHPDLARIARMRATELVSQPFEVLANLPTAHISPVNGLMHTEYANAMGLRTNRAGENLILASSPQRAVTGWMNSRAGHREAILHHDFHFVAAGVYYGESPDGVRQAFWTLWFMFEHYQFD